MVDVLNIVIPVYNEGANYPPLWAEVDTCIRAVCGVCRVRSS